MRKLFLSLFVFSFLFAGCEEERTGIVLKGFTNTIGSEEVYITLSSQYFTPTYDIPVSLQTVVFPAAPTVDITKDIVLLDVPAGEESELYYLYILEDSDASGTILSGDQCMPVLQIQPESGETLKIYGLINSFDYSYPLGPDFRLWLDVKSQLSLEPSGTTPLYVLLVDSAGPYDFTAITPSIATEINNSNEMDTLCYFLNNSTFTYFAYMDMDNSGTINSGDYVTNTTPTSVSDSLSLASGDNDYTLYYSVLP